MSGLGYEGSQRQPEALPQPGRPLLPGAQGWVGGPGGGLGLPLPPTPGVTHAGVTRSAPVTKRFLPS